MRRLSISMLALLFGLSPGGPRAAQNDAAGCQDHPLVPRVAGYDVELCHDSHDTSDVNVTNEGGSETLHLEGKSWALAYRPKSEVKMTEEQLRRSFDEGVRRQGGGLVGATEGQSWPVYRIAKDGKVFLVFLMVTPAPYFDGTYAVRIAEQGEKSPAAAKAAPGAAPKLIRCEEHELDYPLHARRNGYQICGCGGFEAADPHPIAIVQGKNPETIRVAGKYRSVTYCPQEDAQPKLDSAAIRRHFDGVLKKQGGVFLGQTNDYDGKKDVYRLKRGKQDVWVEVWPESMREGMYTIGVTPGDRARP